MSLLYCSANSAGCRGDTWSERRHHRSHEYVEVLDAAIMADLEFAVFAVGNSLADLVANVTVAQFAPAMAYAACFGGP
jgi:hypothetical protein